MGMQRITSSMLPTEWGNFTMLAYGSQAELYPHLVLMHEDISLDEIVTMRIHSECMTGDVFHSLRCDCGHQLHKAMEIIAQEKGLLIYLRQEGRGIGLINKMHAYNEQDKGLDTVEANEQLGFGADQRDYQCVLDILQDLKVSKIKLLTNNPEKTKVFDQSPIQLVERLPLVIQANTINQEYLKTKEKKFGHWLTL